MSAYPKSISNTEHSLINSLVEKYRAEQATFQGVAEALHLLLTSHPELKQLVHSSKFRAKDSEHLRDKLLRKLADAKEAGRPFGVTPGNLFTKITDLAGVRLLHLHTEQMTQMHPLIVKVLKDNMYSLVEDPTAHTWDDEYRAYFKKLGIKSKPHVSMYTSVHYVLAANNRIRSRCELQVRTLMEEVWGEVSHQLNYPHETKSLACQEQLKVLARLASSGTRLVDAIVESDLEYRALSERIARKRKEGR